MGKTVGRKRRWATALRPRSASGDSGSGERKRLCYCGGRYYSSRSCSNRWGCPRWVIGSGSWGRTAKLIRRDPALADGYPTLRLDKLGLQNLGEDRQPAAPKSLRLRSVGAVRFNEDFKQRLVAATARLRNTSPTSEAASAGGNPADSTVPVSPSFPSRPPLHLQSYYHIVRINNLKKVAGEALVPHG